MDCRHCGKQLFSVSQLFFYLHSEKQVHLSLRPELHAPEEESPIVIERVNAKKVTVNCKSCLKQVGRQLPFGPSGTTFVAFGTDKVVLCGRRLSAKDVWREVLAMFPSVVRRTNSQFFGDATVMTQEPTAKNIVPTFDPVKFASISSPTDFDWSLPLSPKVARLYQVTAFVEAMQRDLVVVIPTGAGKTLIASLLLLQMRKLNPTLLGVVVDDRIPLVFQQADSIALDTGLRVCRLCGENRTSGMLRNLRDGSFDVLVATAGALYEVLTRKELSLRQFSCVVFDECHHASGAHRYTDLLQLLKALPRGSRPRILGLTASPFPAKTPISACNNLREFLQTFGIAAVYRPEAPRLAQQPVEWDVINTSSVISRFVEEATALFNQLLGSVTSRGSIDTLHRLNGKAVKGQLKAIKHGFLYLCQADEKLIDALLLVLASLDIATQIGIQEALSVLGTEPARSNDSIKALVNKYKAYNEISPKLIKLFSYLERCDASSRTLVFVDTREVCRRLLRLVSQKFEHLNPARVVGQGGHDGMSWEEEQQATIHCFNEGVSNVVICTSVLEEGLDIPQCDLVIRYSSNVSLIKFVQTRGRARKDASRFVVFVDPEERERITEMEEQERIMDSLLKQHADHVGLPSATTLQIIQQAEGIVGKKAKKTATSGKVDDTCALKITVADAKKLDASFQTALIEELEQSQNLKVQKLLLLDKSDRGGTMLVPAAVSFMVSVRSLTRGIPADVSYHGLCEHWNFSVKGFPRTKIWSQFNNQSIRSSGQFQVEWPLTKLSFGNFISRQHFEESAILDSESPEENTSFQDWRSSFKLRFIDNRTIEIRLGKVTASVPFSTISRFSLIDWNRSKRATLYIPLVAVPSITSLNDSMEKKYVNLEARGHVQGLEKFLLDNFAKHAVVALHFSFGENPGFEQWQRLRKVLGAAEYFPVPLYDTRVEEIRAQTPHLPDLEAQLHLAARSNSELENFLWNISVIKSQRSVCFPESVLQDIYRFVLDKQESAAEMNEAVKSIEEWTLYSYWMDLRQMFTQSVEQFQAVTYNLRPETQHLIKRIVITPSRNVYYSAVPVRSSRLLRTFSGYHFLTVAFRDEELQKLHGVSSFGFVGDILREGLYLDGRSFYFLCSSASQLREHKAVFVEADSLETVLQIRSGIIKNQHEFRSIAQYSSRLGLFCTGDRETLKIAPETMIGYRDVLAANGSSLTDGAGFVRASLASRLAETLGLKETPSVFQIRIAGIKGILLVVEDVYLTKLGGSDCNIIYRDSMKKFESDHFTLGVVSYSKFIPLRLNREIISLLESLKFGADAVLQEKLEKTLGSVAGILMNPQAAVAKLKELSLQSWDLEKLCLSGINFLQEPFWLRILQGAYDFVTEDLKRGAKIPVEEAAILLGAPDPLGLLRDGQVFVRVHKDENSEPFVVTGKVIVYRNPCLHPGDVRLVTAVDIPCLHYYKNVILMPARLNCTYSLSATCSGGDLDGDLFSIIWDPDLLPPPSNVHTPLDYGALSKNAPSSDNVLDPAAMADFYVHCMLNDTLGRVAHVHLALCDQLDSGAADPLAMKLAESQSVAVDFPKTGIAPEVPTAALELVKDKGYPDFMEKGEANSYYSKKVLGDLYRRCCSVSSEIIFPRRFDLDSELLVPGYKNFLECAKREYASYSRAMKTLMYQFGLTEEYEVILGQAQKWDLFLQSDIGKASLVIQESFQRLKREFQARFRKAAATFTDTTSRKALASAWYYIAYSSKDSPENRQRFLSFPWIVSDVLCTIKNSKQNSDVVAEPLQLPIYKDIGTGVRAHFLENSASLSQLVSLRSSTISRISSAIEKCASAKNPVKTLPYGSVSIFLCDSASDVDITVIRALQNPGPSHDCVLLSSLVSVAIDGEVEAKREILNVDHPHIRCKIKDGDHMTDADISLSRTGLRKTEIIHRVYWNKPYFLPCLWLLVRWARAAGIIKDNRVPAELSLIPAADFYGLVLNLICPGFDTTPGFDSTKFQSISSLLDALIDKIENLNSAEIASLGETLVQFFQKGSNLKSDCQIDWKDPSLPKSIISSSVIKEIRVLCTNALHCLLGCRSAEYLIKRFHSSSKDRISATFKLPLSLSSSFGSALQFHANRLSLLTNAQVELVLLESQAGIMLKATGTRPEIFRLHEELQNLIFTNRSTLIGIVQTRASRYFMSGSDLLLVSGSNSSSSRVEFVPSCGPFQLRNSVMERCTIKLSTKFLPDWKLIALEKFVAHWLLQLSSFPLGNSEILDTLDISSRFGCFYLIHVSSALPETQRTLSVDELQTILRKSRRSRKNYARNEFDGEVPDPTNELSEPKLTKLGPSPHNPAAQSGSVKYLEVKQHKNLNSGFATGLNLHNKSDGALLSRVEAIFCESLKRCGFQEVPWQQIYVWKACVTASRSYEATVFMDQNLKITKFHERELRWTDSQILHGEDLQNCKDIMGNVDTRIGVSTAEPLKPGTPLFELVFPQGPSTPPVKLNGNMKPTSADHMSRYSRDKIHFVHYKPKWRKFIYRGEEFQLGCEARISAGVGFQGLDLKLEQPYCKLSLHFDSEPLKKILKGSSSRTGSRNIAEQVFLLSLNLAQTIKDVCAEFKV